MEIERGSLLVIRVTANPNVRIELCVAVFIEQGSDELG